MTPRTRPALALLAAVPLAAAALTGCGSSAARDVAAQNVAPAAHAVRDATLYPLPADPVQPEPCPPPPGHHGGPPRPLGKPAVAENKVPAPVKVPARKPNLDPIKGTGTWVTVFKGGTIDAAAIVRQTAAAGEHSIWIRVGSSHEGFFGGPLLADLLPLAHADGISVIGWDFVYLSNPVADAGRAWAALKYRSPSGDKLDGFSPDLEWKTEGTFETAKRAQAYLSRVQKVAYNRPIIATVYRPTDYWWNGPFPYHAMAPYVDAFAPMIYWSCNEPGTVTAQAVSRLRSLGKPVHVIGQAYDMGPYGGRPGLPSGREIWRFLDVAKRTGADGASLYLYSQTTAAEWKAMKAYPW